MPGHGLVLVVEDERSIADLLKMYLTREGFGVHIAADGPEALAAVRAHRPVAIILDVGLPTLAGTEVCRRLRADDDWTPVLFCTARDDEIDKVLGLELGADDYITKPFSPREVVARLKAVLRRSRGVVTSEEMAVGDVAIDLATHRCTVAGTEIALTATEFDLLAYLMSKPGRVFTREQLLSEVWGYSSVVTTRTVDVHIAQLRSKLGEPDLIRTVRGVGYAIELPAADVSATAADGAAEVEGTGTGTGTEV
ncbi:MAG TPA: response regulator transcription factor [Actinomycetota bacterium]|nr:response regulator transcription factor [Actinomycetota bacterium]